MQHYLILEHTADTGFRAWDATEADLFERSAEALIAVALDPAAAEPEETHKLSAAGDTREDLLVNFLNEVLFLLDARRFVPACVEIVTMEEGRVEARAHGEPREDTKHPPRIVVKAVTYHQLKIEQTPTGWQAEVFLDV